MFFWQSKSCFSQHFMSDFTINNITFCCGEQYMMYRKALLFHDSEMANMILGTRDPKMHKRFGRMVQNFDSEIWEENCRQIVYEANYAKFSQNEILLESLLAEEFRNKTFVEASPMDCVWGIGVREDAARKMDPSQWRGKNWLGLELTRVRDDLLKLRQ